MLDRFVGAVICGFELAVWAMFEDGLMVETAIGERAAQTFVEEQKQQCNLNALQTKAVSVTRTVTLDQSVSLELA